LKLLRSGKVALVEGLLEPEKDGRAKRERGSNEALSAQSEAGQIGKLIALHYVVLAILMVRVSGGKLERKEK